MRQTFDNTGTPLSIVNYDPWGNPENGTVPTFGFTGELQDAASGLVNLRARWYSTTRGTFTSVDPFAGMPEMPYSQHQYQYGYSDPVLYGDPSGKNPALCFAPLLLGPETAPLTGACLIVVGVTALAVTGYATYEAYQCAQRSCLVPPVQDAIQHFSNDGNTAPRSSAPVEPPPSNPLPPTAANPAFGQPWRLGSPFLTPDEVCPLSGATLLPPQLPYTSGPWEQPVQGPMILMTPAWL